ncbi:hypothetical protein HPP92_007563 [Vanilla planifolia]|uniref:Probable sodium/metabolite cotransporter BASS4, chloroplastic n=1 Tax=Vanilla planifolia TaxID=51239 RepID=A0A835REA4_VANPL|nr:hypothetical protein HPP92_007563 [Vanilla planifolia]
MAATLQTLAFRSPMAEGGGISRIAPLPMNQARFGRHHLVPRSLSLLSRQSLHVIRLARASSGSDQAYGNNQFNSNGSWGLFLWTKQVLNFARSNFVPIGLTLRSKEISTAVEAWPAGILGLTSILLVTPFSAWVILQVNLSPREFVTGLAIFCCMPTTLSSGVALTQLVGGNSALALAMTVVSNLLGIMIVPFSLTNFVGGEARVFLPTMQLFKSLVMTLLVPLAMGKVLRHCLKSVAAFVDQNRQYVAMISATLLSIVPGTQVSRSKPQLLRVRPENLVAAVIMGLVVHLIFLALNAIIVGAFSFFCGGQESILAKRENARAVIIVASQKTLPVMVAVVEQLRGAFGEPGLLVLPCVAAHINQIIIDSFLVNWWIKKNQMAHFTKQV